MLRKDEIDPEQRVALWERRGETWTFDRSYPGEHIRNDHAWWAWLHMERERGIEVGFFPEGEDPNDSNLCKFVEGSGRVQTGCDYCDGRDDDDDQW